MGLVAEEPGVAQLPYWEGLGKATGPAAAAHKHTAVQELYGMEACNVLRGDRDNKPDAVVGTGQAFPHIREAVQLPVFDKCLEVDSGVGMPPLSEMAGHLVGRRLEGKERKHGEVVEGEVEESACEEPTLAEVGLEAAIEDAGWGELVMEYQ